MNWKQLYLEWAAKYFSTTIEWLSKNGSAADRARFDDQIEEDTELYARTRAKTEFVRSRYRAAWYGVVTKREKRKGAEDLCTVMVCKDRRGNWMRKPVYRTISEHWLVPCEGWFYEQSPWVLGPWSDWGKIFVKRDAVKARRAKVKSLKRQWKTLE